MIINPMIPIWLMAILCIVLLIFKRKGTGAYIRQIVVVLLLFLINLRFMVPGEGLPAANLNVDITFVIDNTISMLAEDYAGENTRLDAVKKDCNRIIEQFPGASFSVVTFDETVQQLTPYTVDVTMIKDTISTINGQTRLYATGTHLNDIMKDLGKVLKNERTGYQLLFFISDGEMTDDGSFKGSGDLKKMADAGAVLGYGTEKGGPMKVVYFEGSEDAPEYLTIRDDNFDEQKALSKINEKNLKQIASDFGIDYVHMEKPGDADRLIGSLQAKVKAVPEKGELDRKDGYKDIYFWFVIPLVIVLIWDCICFKRK